MMRGIVWRAAAAVTAALPFLTAAARDITSLSVDADAAAVTVSFAAGETGDGHILYYAWSNDGADKGADIAAWPNVVRLGRVADDATVFSFSLPAEAALTGLYSARAFLAETTKRYDNFIGGVKSEANAYVDTGVKPQGGKTSVTVDFSFASATVQYYIFGTWKSDSFSFCAYINGEKKWAYACKKATSPWTPTTLAASTKRTVITLDSVAPRYSVSNAGGSVNVTPSGVGTTSTSYPIYLFGRNNGGVFDKKSKATVYSCVITNDGVCVRDYRPAVYGGVVGLYDLQNNTFTGSGNSYPLLPVGGTNLTFEVEKGDVVAAVSSAFIRRSSDLVAESPSVEVHSFTSATGGSKIGPAPLILAGANDWGGRFSVDEGALIADFGQGLAATDNLVFNGGTYGLHTGNVFQWTIGEGGGETSLGTGAATSLGFTAYGNPFSVIAGGNQETPIEFGAASSTGFNPARFTLNDDWATETVTLKNGITGAGGSSAKPNLKIYTGSAAAVIEGDVTGVNLYKLGSGRLVLRGADNALGALYPQGGRLVVAPPEGRESCTLRISGTFQTSANTDVVISNAVMTHSSAMLCRESTKVTLVGCTSTADGEQSWSIGNDDTWRDARWTLDGSTVKTEGYVYVGKSQTTKGYVVMTNNSSLTTSLLHALQGTMDQYDGTVRLNSSKKNAGWLGQGGTFTYRLWSGSLIQANSDKAADFAIGNTSNGKGVLSVYRGGTFAAYGGGVYLARGGSGDNGQLNVRGGAVHLRGAGAALYIGYKGSGTVDVSDGGVLDVLNGTIVAVPKDQDVAGRTGTLRVTDGGTVKARTVYSDTAVSTAAIVLDGGNVVANAGSATNDLIYGFTSAAVGVGGATIDTNGQDKRISQSFAARTGTGQSVPTAESAEELASLPAFTKVGAGTLSLTGENGWSCATCVSNGTLSVASGALPATTLRLGGGVIDLCGASHTVANLIGFGVVSNGTLTVTGTVWPGADGAGVLKIDATASVALSAIGCRVGPQGTCGLLDVDGTLDISGVRLLGENLAGRNADRGLTLVRARALTGRPATLRVGDLGVTVDGARLRLGVPGTTIILR